MFLDGDNEYVCPTLPLYDSEALQECMEELCVVPFATLSKSEYFDFVDRYFLDDEGFCDLSKTIPSEKNITLAMQKENKFVMSA